MFSHHKKEPADSLWVTKRKTHKSKENIKKNQDDHDYQDDQDDQNDQDDQDD